MNRRLAVMLAVALLLLAYVLWGEGGLLRQGPDGGAPEAPPARGTASTAGQSPAPPSRLNPLTGLAPGAYPAIAGRPLFNPGRRPRPPEPVAAPVPDVEPQPAPAPEPTGPAAGDYKLLAVSGSPAGHVAALRVAATGEVLYLRQGQPVGQWSVLSIGDREVTVGAASGSVTLRLFEDAAAGQDAAPAMPEMAPAP